jgi:tRNA A37 threonylcarbamoyladenosine biosynthesis protein TsaE
VEWAEKGEGILPAAAVRITLALRDASSREITVEGLPESVEAALSRQKLTANKARIKRE